MKALHVGLVAAAAVMMSASVALAQPNIDGTVQTIVIHCTGVVPDSCSGVVDVLAGAGSGYAYRIFIPAGTQIAYGSARAPITTIEAGDHVRIDYNAAPSGNTATGATVLGKPGATLTPDDRQGGF
ncbi:MAG TPA: hypothetical protein VGX97_06285 [bacterium]|nr:hypothetical protein [bacterium]